MRPTDWSIYPKMAKAILYRPKSSGQTKPTPLRGEARYGASRNMADDIGPRTMNRSEIHHGQHINIAGQPAAG
jgi:hypothetical protein